MGPVPASVPHHALVIDTLVGGGPGAGEGVADLVAEPTSIDTARKHVADHRGHSQLLIGGGFVDQLMPRARGVLVLREHREMGTVLRQHSFSRAMILREVREGLRKAQGRERVTPAPVEGRGLAVPPEPAVGLSVPLVEQTGHGVDVAGIPARVVGAAQ